MTSLHADEKEEALNAIKDARREDPDEAVARMRALILDRLDEDKAQDVVVLDLAEQTSIADAMVIASGRSHRHVGAMADHLVRALKDAGFDRPALEGAEHADWVLIDAGDVIVHLFRPEVRAFYNLEKIWGGPTLPHAEPGA